MAKAKGGKKYRLVIYQEVFDRWWPTVLALALFILAWGGAAFYLGGLEKNPLPTLHRDDGLIMLIIGGVTLVLSFVISALGKMAYVQLFPTYFKLVTPFFRLNVSYKRINRTVTSQVAELFSPQSMKGIKREIIGPLSGMTAIVIFLNAYPVSLKILKLFLSPFFFYNKTTHFVLIVDDWMNFNLELESKRTGGGGTPTKKKKTSTLGIPSLLDDLRKK